MDGPDHLDHNMITREQAKNGMARYLDEELIAKTPGLKKWALAVSVSPLMARMDALMENRLLKEMGYVSEDGMIDCDKLRQDFLKAASEKGSVTEHLPLIGDVTFGADDIDRLWGCMNGTR